MAEQKSSLKWLWVTLLIIGIAIVGLPTIGLFFLARAFGGNSVGLFLLIPIAIIGLLVWGLIAVLSKKDEASRSVYKQKETLPNMKIQYLFYIVGVIFVFAAVWYFAHEYIAQFPNIIKLILLIVAIVISYVIAEFMRGSDI